MALQLLLVRLREQRRLRALTSEVVERCRDAVWQQVEKRAVGMSAAEARGYIGAKATELVDAEVSTRLHSERDLRPSAHEKLVLSAREEIIELTIAEVLACQAAQRLIQCRAA